MDFSNDTVKAASAVCAYINSKPRIAFLLVLLISACLWLVLLFLHRGISEGARKAPSLTPRGDKPKIFSLRESLKHKTSLRLGLSFAMFQLGICVAYSVLNLIYQGSDGTKPGEFWQLVYSLSVFIGQVRLLLTSNLFSSYHLRAGQQSNAVTEIIRLNWFSAVRLALIYAVASCSPLILIPAFLNWQFGPNDFGRFGTVEFCTLSMAIQTVLSPLFAWILLNVRFRDVGIQVLTCADVEQHAKSKSVLRASKLKPKLLEAISLRDNADRTDSERCVGVTENFRGEDCSGLDLHDLDFSQSNLTAANLSSANLKRAVFGSLNSMKGVNLNDADLEDAELDTVKDLRQNQLSGANLTHAKLPGYLEFEPALHQVDEIAKTAASTFRLMLIGCLVAWVTVGTTPDYMLASNSDSAKLPFLDAQIPLTGYFVLAPGVLVLLFIYFHLYLQKFWEQISAMPATFPDGRYLDECIHPWLLSSIVEMRFPRLSDRVSLPSRMNFFFGSLCVWFLVPITIWVYWFKFLPVQELGASAIQSLTLGLAVAVSFCSYQLAEATLRRGLGYFPSKQEYLRTHVRTDFLLLPLISGFFLLVSLTVIAGPNLPIRAFYPNLQNAAVSKKSKWNGSDSALFQVEGAMMQNRHLHRGELTRAFLVNADLTDALLTNATLREADLRGSICRGTKFGHANLTAANLRYADLRGAEFEQANLSLADLRFCKVGGPLIFEYQPSKGESFLEPSIPNSNREGSQSLGIYANYQPRFKQLPSTRFFQATMRYTDLSGAQLPFCHFTGTLLEGANFTKTNLDGADFSMATSKEDEGDGSVVRWEADVFNRNAGEENAPTIFEDANLTGVFFIQSNFPRANFNRASISRCKYECAKLQGARFENITAKDVDFREANLNKASFINSTFKNCDFSKADLSMADFRKCELEGCQIDGAQLRGAQITPAQLIKCTGKPLSPAVSP